MNSRVPYDAPTALPRRRLLLGAAGLPLLLSLPCARSQVPQKPVVIGWLHVASLQSPGPASALAAFKEGFAEHGWKEGVHYRIEARSAENHPERLRDLAVELAAVKPALVIATSAQTAGILARNAPGIPIVQATGTNPVETRLAESLARPGGMVTGITNLATEVSEKLLEFLVAIEPKVKRVGFLVPYRAGGKEPSRGSAAAATRSAARFEVEAHIAYPTTPEGIDEALQGFASLGVQGLVVMASPLLTAGRKRIIAAAVRQRWPLVAQSTGWAQDGALLSYGANQRANFRRAAYYADRILRGAKPGDLPIEQPREFDVAVNLKTARALGIRIPQSVLVQATRVIE